MAKIGPNERCPCGSGIKFKKCCGKVRGANPTVGDRESALARLAEIADARPAELADALAEFWEGEGSDLGALGSQQGAVQPCFESWFCFDRPLTDGRTPAQHLLAGPLPSGQAAWLQAMSCSFMRLWEIVDIRPGLSITLEELLTQERVVVRERTFSRQATLHDTVAARVNPLGPSGGPEIEAGMLPITPQERPGLLEELNELEDMFEGDRLALSREVAPTFFAHWVHSILDPFLPRLTNKDGEPFMWTTVSFEVLDEGAIRAAFAALPDVEEAGAPGAADWRWTGVAASQETVSLGTLRIRGDRLIYEGNSVQRGLRARALIEGGAAAAVRHLGTAYQDLVRNVKEQLRAEATGIGESEPELPPAEGQIPAHLQEEMALQHYGQHYAEWVDLPVPAIENMTPREAAKVPAMKERVSELIRGIEVLYARALKDGAPAYDPTWMWAELGLDPEVEKGSPPPLAHERVAMLVPGSMEAARGMAARLRAEPEFDLRSSLACPEAMAFDLDIQRVLREDPGLEPILRAMVDFELHQRKTFWVAADLAWTLARTDLDVPARLLRLPFPSFALIFTDRISLSMAERLFAREQGCPLAGHILKIATIYVTQRSPEEVHLAVAIDALGADIPALRGFDLRLGAGDSLEEVLAPLAELGPAARDLVALCFQAVLYATSVGVEPVLRAPPSRRSSRGAPPTPVSSEAVFYLPGTIDISRLKSLHHLERTVEGRALLHRHLVRGHWRRPNPDWKDQRMRWIAPYWKGPPQAAAIEKDYRLLP